MRTLTQTTNLDYAIGDKRFLEQAFQHHMPHLVDFAIRNQTVLKLVRHVRVHGTGSAATCKEYVYNVHRFCAWLGREPDMVLADVWDNDGVPIPKMLIRHADLIDDYVASLLDTGVTPGTASLYAKSVKAWYLANKLVLSLPRYK